MLSGVAGPTDGLRRLDLLASLAPVARAFHLEVPELTSYGGTEIDICHRTGRLAISVQTGRARTNNGALVAVLAAASAPDVDWLIALAPTRYKETPTAQPVRQNLRSLATAAGVDLELKGALVLDY